MAVPDFKGTGWRGHDGVKQNSRESAAGTGGSEPASLGQDVPGQAGRGAPRPVIRWDPGGTRAPGGASTISQMMELCPVSGQEPRVQ